MTGVYDLKFHFLQDITDETDCQLYGYLGALCRNSQIIFETMNVSGSAHDRIVRVTVPFTDSLNEKYTNRPS